MGNNKELKLISIGTRYKFLLVIYGIGLYCVSKEHINDDSVKCLELKFYRGVSSDQMYNSLKDEVSKRDYLRYSKNGISS